MDFYYPNRINDFWRVMGIIFMNDKDALYDTKAKAFRINEVKLLASTRHIALHDTARTVRRLKNNASDKYLEIVEPAPLFDILKSIPLCHDVVATGEKAASVIARLTDTPIPKLGEYVCTTIADRGQLRIWRMPSTSRAYPLALTAKAAYYQAMFKAIGLL